jgi:signal transduction histidine kinase
MQPAIAHLPPAGDYPEYLLLVEDDEGLSELFRQYLEPVKLPLERVDTGEAALALLEERPAALLLLDYSLPDMKANEVVEALAKAGQVPPFLVITGQGDERVAVNFMKLGALDYLVKDSLLLERLPSVISRVLRELEVRRRLAESEHALQENQAQLEEHLRQAQKMEAVGQLAGGVAHDFNNILTATLMNLNLLQATPGLPEEAYETLKDLESDARRAAGLTQQLLAFSRRQMMQVRTTDLNELVANLGKMLRRLLGEQIQLTISSHGGPAWAKVDTGMVEQAITNLCANARDAMAAGGRLTLAVQPVVVDEAQARQNPDAHSGAFVRVQVVDTGCGMDATLLSHIFEPFFTTKEVGQGTGLGLSTVYGIVRQHLGWVEVRSQVNQGSTFSLYLPAAQEPLKTAGNGNPVAVVRGAETILLVEAEVETRTKAAACLEGMGYRVLQAAHGVEALKHWEDHSGRVDLLVMASVMPEGISGAELSARLRRIKSNLKVILTGGDQLEPIRPEILRQKGTGFLPKPYATEALASVVRRCLEEAT